MFERIKKYAGSLNLTLFLLICLVGVFKGIDPCERALSKFMRLAGISEMAADIENFAPVGPSEKLDLEITLEDGRVISVLANGNIRIKN